MWTSRAARCSLLPSSSCAIRRTGSRRRGRTRNSPRSPGSCSSRGTGTSCRWWRPRSAWARRSPSRRGGGRCTTTSWRRPTRSWRWTTTTLSGTRATTRRTTTTTRAAPLLRSRRRRRSSCRRSCPSVVTSWARRRRCRPLPTTSCRARSPSRRCWRGSTRRRRTTVETTTLRGPWLSRPDSTPSRSASARPGGTPSSNRAMKSRIPPSWRLPANWRRLARRRCGIRNWRSRHSSGRPGVGTTGREDRGTPSSMIPIARTASTPGRA
mmetsp:Transcript_7001/g.17939  ORF Transcript_7001/g.17939 Transcript_7001/m.17939 type:complete len:267 (+) Transcript_7001:1123-1923(+)